MARGDDAQSVRRSDLCPAGTGRRVAGPTPPVSPHEAAILARLAAALRPALAQWGLEERAQLELLAISENATFLARDADGRELVLRVHRPGYHSRAEIASELAWIRAVGDAGIVPTLTPVPRRDGSLIGTITEEPASHGGLAARHVVAFGRLPGTEPAAGAELARWFGRLGAITARLHRHARAWRRPAAFTRKRWDFAAMLGPAPLWGDWRAGPGLDAAGRAVLERAARVLEARLDAYGTGPERFGLVHADLRLSNLLVEGDTLAVIDFDDCGFSWYLYDFAAAISFHEHEPYVPALQAAWIAGYRSVAPLEPADIAMLPVFILLRRMLLTAWIASHAETPTAQQLGAPYTAGTVELARRFLVGEG